MLGWTRACRCDGNCASVQGLVETVNMIEGRRGEGLGPVIVRTLIMMVLNKLVPQDTKFELKCRRSLLDVELAQWF